MKRDGEIKEKKDDNKKNNTEKEETKGEQSKKINDKGEKQDGKKMDENVKETKGKRRMIRSKTRMIGSRGTVQGRSNGIVSDLYSGGY
jgi:hypothetical protein